METIHYSYIKLGIPRGTWRDLVRDVTCDKEVAQVLESGGRDSPYIQQSYRCSCWPKVTVLVLHQLHSPVLFWWLQTKWSYSVLIKFKCLSFSDSKDILFYSSSKRRCSILKITQEWDSSLDNQDWFLEKPAWKLLEDL